MKATDLDLFHKTVQMYDQSYIWIKPVCDFFGINYENQTRKISSDTILANQSTKKSSSLIFGDNYLRVLLTKKGFIRWIQLINANTISDNLREQFIKYQSLVFDFLYGSFEENEAIRVEYARNKKLRRLSIRIQNEIRISNQRIQSFMDGRFLQQTIDFSSKKQSVNDHTRIFRKKSSCDAQLSAGVLQAGRKGQKGPKGVG